MPKISFYGEAPIPQEEIERNVLLSRDRPRVKGANEHGRRLAVVGGGPSLVEHIEELRAWDGDIWAINGVCRFLRERGIPSVLFTIDPHPCVAQLAHGATDALMVSRCSPEIFDALKDARVTVFDLQQDKPGGIVASSSSATAAFHLSVELGYRDVTFFGCDGSYGDATHAYQDEKRIDQLVVSCGGREYLTAPDFYHQSLELAPMLRKFPSHFHERSGGLLRALIENDDHDIVKVSRSIYNALERAA